MCFLFCLVYCKETNSERRRGYQSAEPAACLLHSTEHAQRPSLTNCLSDITAQKLYDLKGNATNFTCKNRSWGVLLHMWSSIKSFVAPDGELCVVNCSSDVTHWLTCIVGNVSQVWNKKCDVSGFALSVLIICFLTGHESDRLMDCFSKHGAYNTHNAT